MLFVLAVRYWLPEDFVEAVEHLGGGYETAEHKYGMI
jgi:hypothetical protein